MEQAIKKVLVVEDDAGIANMLRAILRIGNVDAVFAEDGFTAMRMLDREQISMVLCDIMLPDVSGFEVLQRVRQDVQMKDMPFVFVTSLADPADVKKGMDAGANRYITKPFTARDILDTVQDFLADGEVADSEPEVV